MTFVLWFADDCFATVHRSERNQTKSDELKGLPPGVFQTLGNGGGRRRDGYCFGENSFRRAPCRPECARRFGLADRGRIAGRRAFARTAQIVTTPDAPTHVTRTQNGLPQVTIAWLIQGQLEQSFLTVSSSSAWELRRSINERLIVARGGDFLCCNQ